MAQPVVVSSYVSKRSSKLKAPPSGAVVQIHALPPASSYAFTDVLRSADSPELQSAIDGIVQIYAKSRLSLADEYSSHLPPVGELTAASSAKARSHLFRPGARRALTSVPEGSSGSSEGSRKSQKKRTHGSIFGFRKQQPHDSKPGRRIRIGTMGRTVTAWTTTALTVNLWSSVECKSQVTNTSQTTNNTSSLLEREDHMPLGSAPANAKTSLRNLLVTGPVLPND